MASALVGCALAVFPAKAQYGGNVPVSDIDPSVFQIDETKFLGTKVKGDMDLLDAHGKAFKSYDQKVWPL